MVGGEIQVGAIERRGLTSRPLALSGRCVLRGESRNELRCCRYIATPSPLALELVEDQAADHGRDNPRDDRCEKLAHGQRVSLVW